MRRGLRNLTLVALGIVLLLLAGVSLGWISPSAFFRGEAEDGAGDAVVSEAPAPDVAEPALRGRAADGAPTAAPAALPAPVDLDAVDRTRDVHGVVVHEDGTPVAGAIVQVLTHPWRHQDLLMDHGLWDVDEGPQTQSASDGTFCLGLDPGAPIALYVSAGGLAPVELHLRQAGERVRVVLSEPARMRVVVRGPDGEPVEGTSIRLFHRGGHGREARGVTDEDGVLVLDALEPGRRGWIDVTPPRFGNPGWVQITTPAAGEETTVEVDLVEGRTLRGRVTDAATGAGVAGARVGMNWVLRPEVKTDASGAYALPGWTANGVVDIHVLAEGYAREARVVGTQHEIDVVLTPVPAVVGRVLDDGGKPIAGARVHAIGSERKAGRSALSVDDTKTGTDGRYRLTGLTPGMMHTLVVVAPGFGRTWQPFTISSDGDDVVDLGDLTLSPGLVLAGVVVDAEDVPLARVELELQRGDGEFTTTRGATLDLATDDLGRFRFPDLSAGTYRLRVRPPDGVETSQVIELENEDVSDLRVVIAANVEVVVLVIEESGAPVPDAYVSFVGTGRRHARAQTDADGRAVAQLPADRVGEYTVGVFCRDRADLMPGTPHALAAEDREVEIVLRRAFSITGRVETIDGTPVQSMPFSIRRGDEVVAWAHTQSDGTFVCRLEPGPPVDLVFDGRGMGAQAATWRDFGGRLDGVSVGATDVVLTVRPVAADRFVEVRVLYSDGNPAVGVMVIVPGETGPGAPVPVTDETGTTRIEGLRNEEVGIKVIPRHTDAAPWAAPPEVRVVPEGQQVVVRLRRARLLEGRVTCESAAVPAWVQLRVERTDGTLVSEGGAVRDGTFQLAVPLGERGPLVLVAEGRIADGSTVTGRMEIPPPESGAVTVELRAR